jgi:hypothetical protein
MKRKPDGTFYGHGHVRKFHYAIIFGDEEANVLLLTLSLQRMSQRLTKMVRSAQTRTSTATYFSHIFAF